MKTETNYKCPRYRASVLLAHADGKPIEITSVANEGEGGWILSERPLFNFREFDFRVAAPKPAEPIRCRYYNVNTSETLPMIEMTTEVIAALNAAGIETGKEGDQ